jgi:hypothetical protein
MTNKQETTLQEAKDHLRENFEGGTDCPCCGQSVKLYKRKLNSSMAYVLVLMASTTEIGEFVHVPSLIAGRGDLKPAMAAAVRGDWAKLKHWGFIASDQQKRPDGSKRSGWWAVTTPGRLFALGKSRAKSHVHIYNGKSRAYEVAGTVSIEEALGDRFNFSELMGDER